jgi:hypothetical protein
VPPEVPGVGLGPHFAAPDVVLYVAGLWPSQVQKLVAATWFDEVTPEMNATSAAAPGGGVAATDIPLPLVRRVAASLDPDALLLGSEVMGQTAIRRDKSSSPASYRKVRVSL